LCKKVDETLHHLFEMYMLSISSEQQVKTSTQPSFEMGMEDFDALEMQFAMEFEKDMSLNESMNKNKCICISWRLWKIKVTLLTS